jgi:hypothetical protein
MLVYAVLNASRSVVISGVVRLCWKWMSPNLFTYSATATLDVSSRKIRISSDY